jgi:hypothetical protein
VIEPQRLCAARRETGEGCALPWMNWEQRDRDNWAQLNQAQLNWAQFDAQK